MMRGRLLLMAATFMLTAGLMTTGCGMKGDPIPPRAKPLPVIADLSVSPVPNGFELVWSVKGSGEGRYKISRSERAPDGGACQGCPQEYLPVGALNVGGERLQPGRTQHLRYFDYDVKEGNHYSYRVTYCTTSGFCGEASNEAGPLQKGR